MNPAITVAPGFCLRVLSPQDTQALFEQVDRNRAHLRQWMPWVDGTRTADDIGGFIEKEYQRYKQGEAVNYGIRIDDELIGVVGFHGFDRVHRVTSLGYWLAKDFCGRGIMLRAVAHSIEYAFKQEKMNRLFVRCAVKNRKSQQIPRKLGLKHEGTQRQAEFLYDHYVDLDVFSVLAEEWDSSILSRISL